MSSASINVSVEATGHLKSKSAGVLKMFKHRNSGEHKAAERILATTENKVMEQISARLEKSREHSTQRIFRTAYYLAKRRRPFADMSELVDSQALNGTETGRVLNSDRCLLCSSHSAHCGINETATV